MGLAPKTEFIRWAIKWGRYVHGERLYHTETAAKIARTLLERKHNRLMGLCGAKPTTITVVKVTVIVEN